MKTYIRTKQSKIFTKKRILLINASVFIVLMTLMTPGCIEEDYPVRLVFPELTTAAASNITASSATSGGEITYDGGIGITARGVCWSVYANPSIAFPDSTTADGTGIGQFSSNIDGLLANKTYHIRAYATNPEGTAYGQDITIVTSEP